MKGPMRSSNAVYSSRADQHHPMSSSSQAKLDVSTAKLAEGCEVVNIFVNDVCSKEVIKILADVGVKLISLRCAGFDRVDVEAANAVGIKVVRVPTYSPQSVAEHAVAHMFALNRCIAHAHQRTAQGNYSLNGLVGFEMYKKTVGVIGTGAIGYEAIRILKKRVLAIVHLRNTFLKRCVTHMSAGCGAPAQSLPQEMCYKIERWLWCACAIPFFGTGVLKRMEQHREGWHWPCEGMTDINLPRTWSGAALPWCTRALEHVELMAGYG
eukprot:33067-Pelagomonas_calceolata.AAC.5